MNIHIQKTISVKSTPSTILQGAYEAFVAPAETVTELQSAGRYESISPLAIQISFATDPPIEDWLKFQTLVVRWQHERGAMSSITEAVLCPAYQTIIGMGEPVVPFLLAQLEAEGDDPDQWFWALQAITGVALVKDEDRGNYVRMAAAWLGWARDQGYAW